MTLSHSRWERQESRSTERLPPAPAGRSRIGVRDGSVANLNMINDAGLSGQNNVVPDARAAGDSHLGGNQRILADHDVVRELHEIVDFGAAANHGFSESCAVDRSIGADFHIVPTSTLPACGILTRAAPAPANPNPSAPITAPA